MAPCFVGGNVMHMVASCADFSEATSYTTSVKRIAYYNAFGLFTQLKKDMIINRTE